MMGYRWPPLFRCLLLVMVISSIMIFIVMNNLPAASLDKTVKKMKNEVKALENIINELNKTYTFNRSENKFIDSRYYIGKLPRRISEHSVEITSKKNNIEKGREFHLKSMKKEFEESNYDVGKLLKKIADWRRMNRFIHKDHSEALASFETNYNSIVKQLLVNENIRTAIEQQDLISYKNNFKTTSMKQFACVVDLTLQAACGTSVGFASLIVSILDGIAFCDMNGFTPSVILRGCWAYCGPTSRHINYWEWYFEPLNTKVINTTENAICYSALAPNFTNLKVGLDLSSAPYLTKFEGDEHTYKGPKQPLLNLSFRKRNLLQYGAYDLIDDEVRKRAYYLIHAYLKVHPDILRFVDGFENKYFINYNILGVHVRATDHGVETESKMLPPLHAWIVAADKVLKTMPEPRRIFLATDNKETTEAFKKYFGKDKTLYLKAHRATKYDGSEPVYMSGSYNHPRRLGSEVLSDILLLSRSSMMLHAESNVAALSSYFNPKMQLHFMTSKAENVKNVPKQPTTSNLTHEEEEDNFDLHEMLNCLPIFSEYNVCPKMKNYEFLKTQ